MWVVIVLHQAEFWGLSLAKLSDGVAWYSINTLCRHPDLIDGIKLIQLAAFGCAVATA
jgi:hypothetical protein